MCSMPTASRTSPGVTPAARRSSAATSQPSSSSLSAEQWAFRSAIGAVTAGLDGDSVPDSPPDAGTAYYKMKGWNMCSGPASYMIPAGSGKPGFKIAPMRTNMMSYFVCGSPRFTPGQIARIRQTLKGPRSSVALSAPPSLDLVTQPAPEVQAVPPKPGVPFIKARDQSKAPATVARPPSRLPVRPPLTDSQAVERPKPR